MTYYSDVLVILSWVLHNLVEAGIDPIQTPITGRPAAIPWSRTMPSRAGSMAEQHVVPTTGTLFRRARRFLSAPACAAASSTLQQIHDYSSDAVRGQPLHRFGHGPVDARQWWLAVQ